MAHTLKEVIDLAIKTAILRAHPIGSYYLTEGTEDPKDFIGGENRLKSLVIQASDDNHAAGTTAEAGLPNIKGELEGISRMDNFKGQGVLQWKYMNYNVATAATSGSAARDIVFDASIASSIYGKSDTVQPPARFVNVWKRVS